MGEKEKRQSGKVTREVGRLDEWLVLKESKKTGNGYVHNCGTLIKHKKVEIKTSGLTKMCDVPYCPRCEKVPISGTHDDVKDILIDS